MLGPDAIFRRRKCELRIVGVDRLLISVVADPVHLPRND